MTSAPPILPNSANLDIRALSKTLDDTSASYKFLWTLGLLDEMEKRGFNEEKPPFPCRGVFAAMLVRADGPVNRFKLSFGASSGAASRDRMEEHLKTIAEAMDKKEPLLLDSSDVQSPKGAALTRVCRDLADYVPLRWLSPFLPQDELRAASGRTRNQGKRNRRIRELASAKFKSADNPPPYCFQTVDGEECVEMNPEWLRYFRRNLPIVRGWALWKWANFLQARNPNIPAILNKIAPPDERERNQLENQRKGFWIPVMRGADGVHCIYSGAALSDKNFHLDHYVPWSFIGHDQIWNLVPADPSVNSSKSDNLPSMRKYFAPFVDLHHRALMFHHEHCPSGKWKKLTEAYVADLRIDFADLTDREKLGRAYKAMISPLIDLAAANRFTPNWIYHPKRRLDALPFN